MKRAEFDWLLVLASITGADLSDRFEGGRLRPDPRPAWPSDHYRRLHRKLSSRIVAPPRDPSRDFGITIEELEAAADALFVEIAHARPADAVIAFRWEEAAGQLVEAKRRAHETRQQPDFFDAMRKA